MNADNAESMVDGLAINHGPSKNNSAPVFNPVFGHVAHMMMHNMHQSFSHRSIDFDRFFSAWRHIT